jgi:hypothetical protein
MTTREMIQTLNRRGFTVAPATDSCGERIWKLRRTDTGKTRASWTTRRGLLEWAITHV